MSYLLMEQMLQNFQAGENHAKPQSFTCSETDDHQVPVQIPSKKKKGGRKNSNNSRRFSEQQIKSLESMFESETKLEPRKKMQLATELGLQPRQVAIWFQNKRARWRSKQIEKDYRTLKANYDNLASRFDSLKNERESLLLQLQRLNDQLLGSPYEGVESFNHVVEGSGDRGIVSVHGNTNFEPEADQKGLDNTVMFNMPTTNDEKSSSKGIENSGDEGHEFLNKGHEFNIDGSFAIASSPYEKWYSFDSGVQFDLSCNGSSASHWFNFWT